MAFKFNPIEGIFDIAEIGGNDSFFINEKLRQILASLSSYDKIVQINYVDEGTLAERISSVVLSSDDFPDANIVKTVFWLDVGSFCQRIDYVQYETPLLESQVIKKTFEYRPGINRVLIETFNYELVGE
jgi:hypothetical protein